MKHLFIVNPCAGSKNLSDAIASKLATLDIEAEIHVTQREKDATEYVKDYCRQQPDEPLRIYAFENVSVGCYPCGSGNDYVKYWQGVDFHDLKALTEAPSVEVDVMKVRYQSDSGLEVRYALNTLNFGFEAEVCRAMDEMRRKPLLGGKMAYPSGILKSLFSGRHNPCRITVDGELWYKGDLMLASLANGRYEGGGFHSAPRSLNDDGWIEATAIRPISIVRFASIIGSYKNGTYLDRKKLQNIVSYRRAKHLLIESDHPFYIGIDGELLHGNHFEIENLPRALRFAVPKQSTGLFRPKGGRQSRRTASL